MALLASKQCTTTLAIVFLAGMGGTARPSLTRAHERKTTATICTHAATTWAQEFIAAPAIMGGLAQGSTARTLTSVPAALAQMVAPVRSHLALLWLLVIRTWILAAIDAPVLQVWQMAFVLTTSSANTRHCATLLWVGTATLTLTSVCPALVSTRRLVRSQTYPPQFLLHRTHSGACVRRVGQAERVHTSSYLR